MGARYTSAIAPPPTPVAAAASGVTDHGALTGLADDDHPQYAPTATAVVTTDARLSDARPPSAHAHADGVYRVIAQAQGSHIAARAAGTYLLPQGEALPVSGTGLIHPPTIIPIYAADYPTVNGVAAKLRVRAQVAVNAVAPTGNYTVGLYPVTSGAGGAGVKIWSKGTLVTGSAAATVTAPAASSVASVVGSDFALPSDGLYVLAVVTTAAPATSSLVHVSAQLQLHNA